MRFEISPKYQAEMDARNKERQDKLAAARKKVADAKENWLGIGWTLMKDCPLAALESWDGTGERIMVTDGKGVTVARVTRRFGTPIFYKKQPEMVFRDGGLCLEGGIEDPRHDLPKWWWKWEIKDELAEEDYAYGERAGQPEVDFVPTHWQWMPDPPKISDSKQRLRS